MLWRKNFAKFQIYPFSLWDNADVRVWEDQGGKYQVGWSKIFLEYIFTFKPINPDDLHSVKVFLHSSRTQFVHGGGGRGVVCVTITKKIGVFSLTFLVWLGFMTPSRFPRGNLVIWQKWTKVVTIEFLRCQRSTYTVSMKCHHPTAGTYYRSCICASYWL